jgi:peptidyl-prolyl cis-trans isomerase SurA
MSKKKYTFYLIILLIFNFESLSKENIYIEYKVNNEIITNIDIEKERQYLVALNVQLKNLDKGTLLKISKESALRELIKKIELSKYYDIGNVDLNIDNYLQNFYKTLNLKNDIEFKQYLKNNNLNINYIEEKIRLEVLWNRLIYDIYKDQINVDKIKLKNQLKKINNNDKTKKYFLSEILFGKEKNSTYQKKIKDIKQSINEIGFNNTANLYSMSDSSKFGGKIGWIEEQKLSKKVIEKLQSLKIGEYTLPIQVGGNFLILKIEEIKFEKKLIDKKKELEKMIQFETNRQLDQFSKIFYKKIKINNVIDEL